MICDDVVVVVVEVVVVVIDVWLHLPRCCYSCLSASMLMVKVKTVLAFAAFLVVVVVVC